MKLFYSIDLTHDRTNTVRNGKQLTGATVSANKLIEYRDAGIRMYEHMKNGVVPLYLRLGNYVCAAATMILMLMIFKPLRHLYGDFYDKYLTNTPLIIAITAVWVVLWIVVIILIKKQFYMKFDSPEATDIIGQYNEISEAVNKELGVPEETQWLDILSFYYESTEDSFEVLSFGADAFKFEFCSVRAFRRDESLCIVDPQCRYDIPISSISAIRTLYDDIVIEDFSDLCGDESKRLTGSGIKLEDDGSAHFDSYNLLEFVHEGEKWGLCFPAYERPAVEKLIQTVTKK